MEPAGINEGPQRARITSDHAVGLILALLGLATIGETIRQLPLGSLKDPGPGYAPVLLGGLLAALGLAIALVGRKATPLTALSWPEWPHAPRVFASAAFTALALEPLGYRLTALTLLLFLIGIVEHRPIVTTLSVSFGIAFGSHYLFATLLRVPLPRGLWGL